MATTGCVWQQHLLSDWVTLKKCPKENLNYEWGPEALLMDSNTYAPVSLDAVHCFRSCFQLCFCLVFSLLLVAFLVVLVYAMGDVELLSRWGSSVLFCFAFRRVNAVHSSKPLSDYKTVGKWE
ncbi:hypothetical protein V6N13_044861 [Hibiscus sabdariffa]|uniref:Uncharacterized protein n=1 Tax=Hibiscus sabdariffa TaxID=183260 RepID=A0ABR2RJS6_9ROSI